MKDYTTWNMEIHSSYVAYHKKLWIHTRKYQGFQESGKPGEVRELNLRTRKTWKSQEFFVWSGNYSTLSLFLCEVISLVHRKLLLGKFEKGQGVLKNLAWKSGKVRGFL